jgi:hypothetical protein
MAYCVTIGIGSGEQISGFDIHESEIYYVGQNRVLFDAAKLQPFHTRPYEPLAVV